MDVKQHIKDAVKKATGRDVEVVIGALPEGMDDNELRVLVSETIERMVRDIKADKAGTYLGAALGVPPKDDDESCCPAAAVGKITAAALLMTLEIVAEAAAKDDMAGVKRAIAMLPIKSMKLLVDKL